MGELTSYLRHITLHRKVLRVALRRRRLAFLAIVHKMVFTLAFGRMP